MTRHPIRLAAACVLFAVAVPAFSAGEIVVQKDPEGVVTLNSTATVDVPKDWMSVSFSVTREGTDGTAVQTALKQALEAALKLAQDAKEPDGKLEVRTGGFSLQPRYNPKGQMNGWSGTTELQVQGRDMPAIATLVGRINTMTISSLDYSLSREAREKVETDLSAQAIAGFRAKAAAYAKAFGYSGYTIREVNVQTDQNQGPPPPRPFAAKAMAMAPAEPLPTDAGKGSVTSNVNGSITLVK
jgi:predicted secreted protein